MRILFLISVGLTAFASFAQNDSTQWSRAADTGRSAGYLSEFEKDVLQELNKARSNPASYATLYLTPMLKDFKGKINLRTRVETTEGVEAITECIRQMKRTAGLGLLYPNEKLSGTASEHTSAQSKTREVGHTSPNGKTFTDRVKKLRFPTAAECISYGEDNARAVVTSLLIDDGVANRGHRKTILNPQLNAAGVSSGGHLTFGHMCTIDFAGGVQR